MSIEQSVYDALVLTFQHDFFYIVPAALVVTYLYRFRG